MDNQRQTSRAAERSPAEKARRPWAVVKLIRIAGMLIAAAFIVAYVLAFMGMYW